jgi:hypothetical protein
LCWTGCCSDFSILSQDAGLCNAWKLSLAASFQVQAGLSRCRLPALPGSCLSADCASHFQSTMQLPCSPLRTYSPISGQRETVRVKWDPTNDQIIFQRNNEPETTISDVGVSDSSPPAQVQKQLRASNDVESYAS